MKNLGAHLSELLVFVALLLPTIIVLAAAVVSLVVPEPSIAVRAPAQATVACETCRRPQTEARDTDDR